ncbi:MAG TPA: GGDEF domain-containing protein [Spirochaetota bacterium]|nr:GGDEF domain-containing protein [Spirochaetota bacterium]HPN81899.1 GGDEF domain-containing protein [Spirochaetota bacterium]
MSEDVRSREDLLRENEMLRRWVSELGAVNTRERQIRSQGGDETCLELYREILSLKTSLREVKERYHAMLGAMPDLLFIQNPDGTYIDYNAFSTVRYYVPPHEFLGKKMHDILPKEVADNGLACVRTVLASGQARCIEYHLSNDGEDHYYEGRVVPCGSDRVLTIVRDITERKRFEHCLREMATHDSLTELPNRLLFQDRLSHAIDRAKRSGNSVALLFLDLDGFKEVNDTCGHAAGDKLLVLMARRLLDTVRDNDTVARLGGDEFAVILEEIQNQEVVVDIGKRILAAIGEHARVEDYDVSVTGSIGIALWPTDAEDSADLLVKADRAMYVAKRGGKNTMIFSD